MTKTSGATEMRRVPQGPRLVRAAQRLAKVAQVAAPHDTSTCQECADNALNAAAMVDVTGSVACTYGTIEHAVKVTR